MLYKVRGIHAVGPAQGDAAVRRDLHRHRVTVFFYRRTVDSPIIAMPADFGRLTSSDCLIHTALPTTVLVKGEPTTVPSKKTPRSLDQLSSSRLSSCPVSAA